MRTDRVEWPTIGVAVLAYGGLIGSVLIHRLVPAVVTVVLLAVFSAWHSSLQHEVIHGHPTRWHAVNVLLAGPPIGLTMPFGRYRDAHTTHHRNHESLTDPFLDPESNYVTPEQWAAASTFSRALLRIQRTVPGRMIVGPGRVLALYLVAEARLCYADRQVRAVWLRHVAGVGAIVLLVRSTGLPLWQYALGAGYAALGMVMLRSFAEHRGVSSGTRSAVVRAGWFFSLLYLNNNLHHTHHEQPSVAWYRLPQLHAAMGSDALAAAGAGLYPGGYWELLRRYAWRPFCQPIHPQFDPDHS